MSAWFPGDVRDHGLTVGEKGVYSSYTLCSGADFVNSARGFMFALGCIQALKCNRNTCPTGVTTHDRRLQNGLDPLEKAIKVRNFVDRIHYGTALIAHSCGVPHQRALTRTHCRIMQPDGKSVLMSKLYSPPEVLQEYKRQADTDTPPA